MAGLELPTEDELDEIRERCQASPNDDLIMLVAAYQAILMGFTSARASLLFIETFADGDHDSLAECLPHIRKWARSAREAADTFLVADKPEGG